MTLFRKNVSVLVLSSLKTGPKSAKKKHKLKVIFCDEHKKSHSHIGGVTSLSQRDYVDN